jgi:hypothetical protein
MSNNAIKDKVSSALRDAVRKRIKRHQRCINHDDDNNDCLPLQELPDTEERIRIIDQSDESNSMMGQKDAPVSIAKNNTKGTRNSIASDISREKTESLNPVTGGCNNRGHATLTTTIQSSPRKPQVPQNLSPIMTKNWATSNDENGESDDDDDNQSNHEVHADTNKRADKRSDVFVANDHDSDDTANDTVKLYYYKELVRKAIYDSQKR